MTISQPQPEEVITLDLQFMGRENAIAAYLIPHQHGAALVECGPGSTTPALQRSLAANGYRIEDITDVFLTHIHLDHAGAAGWLAQRGARIHVHPAGAPHLVDPEKLLSSAKRIYGDMMDQLWGEFLPVPEGRLHILQDGEIVEMGGRKIQAIETLGHANHHFVYLYADICFSGDIGGVRMPGVNYLRLPVPPPDLHLELWRESMLLLKKHYQNGLFHRIAPTHYSIFDDAEWHLQELGNSLDELEQWITQVMPEEPSIDQLNADYLRWGEMTAREKKIDPQILQTYEIANPSWMAAAGIQRYWRKHRLNGD